MTHNSFKTHILGFINPWGRKLTKTKHTFDRWLKYNNYNTLYFADINECGNANDDPCAAVDNS